MKKRILIFFSSLLSLVLIGFAITPNKNNKFFDFFKNPLVNESKEEKILTGGGSSSGGSFASGGGIVSGNTNYDLIKGTPSFNLEFVRKNRRNPDLVSSKLSSWFFQYIDHIEEKTQQIDSDFFACKQSLSASLDSYQNLYYNVIQDFDNLFDGTKSFSSSELDFKISQILSYFFIFEIYGKDYDENVIAFLTKLIWKESVGFVLFRTSNPMPLTSHFVYESNGQPSLFKTYERILSNFLTNYDPQVNYIQGSNFKFEHCVVSGSSLFSL